MDMVQREIVEKYQFKKVLKVVRGGKIRQYSVWNGLKAIRSGCSIVVVHDGVRPLISRRLIAQSIEAAKKNGAAVVAVLARDTVKRTVAGKKVQTLPREEIWLAQTPQTFQYPSVDECLSKGPSRRYPGYGRRLTGGKDRTPDYLDHGRLFQYQDYHSRGSGFG